MRRFGLSLMLALTSCSADPPGGVPDDDPMVDPDDPPDMPDPVPEEPPEEVPLLLGPMPASTYWDSIPVHGSGPAGGTVLVQTEVAGALTVPIASTGNFCIDVPLRADSMNTFELRSVDQSGALGTPISAMVQQQGDPPPPPEGTPSRNASIGGTVTTSESVDGDLNMVIDGDWDSMVTLNNAWFSEDWVWVLLSERSLIEKVVVVSSEDCPMQKYEIMFSDKDAPGDPTSDNTNWTFTEVEVPWAATEITYEPFVSQHVAVRFVSGDCSSWGRGRHVMAELQAWTVPNAAPPAPQAPSCSSGG